MKAKKLIVAILAIVSMCCFFVGCTGNETPPQTAIVYVFNDNNKGVVSGVENEQEVAIGKELSVSIVAKEGFLIKSVKWDGETIVITSKKSVAFTKKVVGDVELYVSYERAPCVVTIINDNTQGEVTGISNGDEIKVGGSISVTISPKEHYKIAMVTFGGKRIVVTNEKGFSFVSTVNASASLVVVYSPVLYSVSVQTAVEGDGDVSTEGANSLGQITVVENGGLYEYGTVITVVVTPNVACEVTIVSITVNGKSVQVNPQGTTFNLTVEEVNQIVITYAWSEGWTPNA